MTRNPIDDRSPEIVGSLADRASTMSAALSIADAIAIENRPHMPDPTDQQAYAEKHGNRSGHGWKELTDIQVASRARMLMRDDLTHEAVCTSVRDRICALAVEKKALVEALETAVWHLRCSASNSDHYYSMATVSRLEEALTKARGQ